MSLKPYYEENGITLHLGDCREVIKTLADCSIDAVVTDPPYELTANKKGGTGPASVNLASPYGRARITTGFMGKAWDGTGAPFDVATWIECLRVLKPGGHLLAFGGSRTYHRLACAIEDAGFEIRDQIQWLYGSGFPKSLDIAKQIDRRPGVSRHSEFADELRIAILQAGFTNTFDVAERVTGRRTGAVANWQKYQWPEARWWPALRDLLGMDRKWDAVIANAECETLGMSDRLLGRKSGIGNGTEGHTTVGGTRAEAYAVTLPATEAAKQWSGWGTALKPAHEPIVVARKPLDGTVAENVLRWGTGGINVDGCRIEMSAKDAAEIETMCGFGRDGYTRPRTDETFMQGTPQAAAARAHTLGRWPANVILSYPEDQYELRSSVTPEQQKELFKWLYENA